MTSGEQVDTKPYQPKKPDDSKLPHDLKPIIDAYLFKWLAALGAANAAVLIGGLVYVFFIIPEQALQRALATVEVQAQSRTAHLEASLLKAASEALIVSGKAQNASSRAESDVAKLKLRLERIASAVEEIESDDVAKVLSLVKALKEEGDIKTILQVAAKVDELTQGFENSMRDIASIRGELKDVVRFGEGVQFQSQNGFLNPAGGKRAEKSVYLTGGRNAGWTIRK